MSNVFKPRANLFLWGQLIGLGLLLTAGLVLIFAWPRWSYNTRVGYTVAQPVPFSHKHHVGALGIDCRFCHQAVEAASSAGMPSTETCMKCHTQIWPRADMLGPVRDSWREGEPIRWNRVHDVPDFVYFNHSIHVNKGVSCVACHGRVDQMPLIAKAETLHMQWCLDCHRDPVPHLRPRDQITNMAWQPPDTKAERRELGQNLAKQYHIDTTGLTNCTTCHR